MDRIFERRKQESKQRVEDNVGIVPFNFPTAVTLRTRFWQRFANRRACFVGVRLNIWVTSKSMSTTFDETNCDVCSPTTRKRGYIPEIDNTGTIKN